MGCGLPRLRRSEESSPGKIYSTLRRRQVETKVGVAYTYRFLDFLLGNAEVPGSSTPCLSSVREVPGQLRELYRQGFLLIALHPFIHPCAPPNTALQKQLYRAVLIRPVQGAEGSEGRWLEMDMCQPAGPFPDNELIQGFVKKVHDAAEQGSMFVGFVSQVSMATAAPDRSSVCDCSLSLHSSPSSFLREELDLNQNQNPNQNPSQNPDLNPELWSGLDPTQEGNDPNCPEQNDQEKQTGLEKNQPKNQIHKEEPTGPVDRMELFSMFNHMGALSTVRFYTIRVPLKLEWHNAAVSQLEAGWLDHMTQHFSSGASLVDGYFHLGAQQSDGVPPENVEGVFVFQEGEESDAAAFDAIVVEQWTVIRGMQVKTDYVPLLQSLALYGWRLTCVLPTPVANSNRDGSLLTKQILFLQRPVLHRKGRENKKLSLSLRSKSRSTCGDDIPQANSKIVNKALPKVVGTMKPGHQVTIEEAKRRAEKEDNERVGRMNDRNRQEERKENEVEREDGVEAGQEVTGVGLKGIAGGMEDPGHTPLKTNSTGQRIKGDPEGGVTENGWADLAGESLVGGVNMQLEGASNDGPKESANEGLGEDLMGRTIPLT